MVKVKAHKRKLKDEITRVVYGRNKTEELVDKLQKQGYNVTWDENDELADVYLVRAEPVKWKPLFKGERK